MTKEGERRYGVKGVPGESLRALVDSGVAKILNFEQSRDSISRSLALFPARSGVAVEWPQGVLGETGEFGDVDEAEVPSEFLAWTRGAVEPDEFMILLPYQRTYYAVEVPVREFALALPSVLEEIPEFWAWFPASGKFIQFGFDWVAEMGDIPDVTDV